MMKCKDVNLNRYIDEELSQEASFKIEEHLKTCKDCSSAYEELQTINEFLSDYQDEEVSDIVLEKIISLSRISVFEKFKKEIISIAASILLFGTLGSFLGFQTNSQNQENSENFYSFNSSSMYDEFDWEE